MPTPPLPRERDHSVLIGCLPIAAGVVLGVAATTAAGAIITDSWAYCTGMSSGEAVQAADSARTALIGTAPLYLAAEVAGFPVGFHIAWRYFGTHALRIRVAAAVAAGLLVLGGAFGADLVMNVGPEGGRYVHALCPDGRPPWWPDWLPLRTSRSPVDFKDRG
ncbi:hypothetical protein [Kitasatospora sp. NPDC059571]|uniref:hypothetical protein n=1 Tax=Kitasatospora sp. NPDC059571 TaxID=3346871 RepID=UPI0036770117